MKKIIVKDLSIKRKTFEKLNVFELYDLLALRTNVFVVEQNCPYPELDYKDQVADHILMYDKTNIVAVARILPPDTNYPEVSIGRVATSALYRRQNIGKLLMRTSLEFIQNKYGNVPVRISAQTYLLKFYESFMFKFTGKSYLEDDIPHIEMLYTPSN